MDDISVFRESLDKWLENLDRVLARCEETNLVLNLKKYHFVVKVGIVLDHKVSRNFCMLAKVEVIMKLLPLISVKGVRSFLRHATFYWRDIKDFSKIARPMCSLLYKEINFLFHEKCIQAFELMCDASGVYVGAVMGKEIEGVSLGILCKKTLDATLTNHIVPKEKIYSMSMLLTSLDFTRYVLILFLY